MIGHFPNECEFNLQQHQKQKQNKTKNKKKISAEAKLEEGNIHNYSHQ
jgi:hypothetical protein